MNEFPGIREFGPGAATTSQRRSSLAQEDFLRLMLAQLRNQDPFQPLQNEEFLGQMAQISTASGIQGIQESFDSSAAALAGSQALQAAALVDREVLVNSGTLQFDGSDNARLALDLPPGAQAEVTIRNAAGEVVSRLTASGSSAGRTALEWNGTDLNGDPVEPGQYRIDAQYEFQGSTVAARTMVWGRVESISLDGARGVFINMNGIGELSLSRVIEIA